MLVAAKIVFKIRRKKEKRTSWIKYCLSKMIMLLIVCRMPLYSHCKSILAHSQTTRIRLAPFYDIRVSQTMNINETYWSVHREQDRCWCCAGFLSVMLSHLR